MKTSAKKQQTLAGGFFLFYFHGGRNFLRSFAQDLPDEAPADKKRKKKGDKDPNAREAV